ncbi:Anaerobic glycerol-3-phosphate dehydrogenase subunit C [Pseudobythopirellula maris]|uniref:Anaerobic glycerol-3-phosphate dehydrogenase subunit C n=1 Tax=Pseudobythopirellula maris TaxID=2527991 RepID=A0A5C5ZW28_9BACT|nr:FAD-binding oxidoreductase [Pseudobythopirellula maris]TWT90463.1 Anaerobic glycerol-3-phosphate dehydrogenase subunit C [Pseudobythopirellula maris]
MDSERQRIEEDLRGLIAGEVRCDDLFLQLYACDASLYEIRPTAVVLPRGTADVSAVLRYCTQNKLPVHARGSGTGLAGGAVGSGVVIDFSRYMHRVVSLGDGEATVQAGVVLDDLNKRLAATGRVFGPDPAMSNVTTLGGMAAVDASGSHRLIYGSVRDHVRSMRVVLSDGQQRTLGSPPAGGASEPTDEPLAIETLLGDLLRERRPVIEEHAPKCPVNGSGYALERAMATDPIDLAQLVVGSEGTLALITELTLATLPLPAYKHTALLLFDSLDKAARASLEIAALGPSACDLMDRRHLGLARDTDPRYEVMLPGAAEAVLLVEAQGDSEREVRDRLAEMIARVSDVERLAAGAFLAESQEEQRLFKRLAGRFTPTLHRLKGNRRAVSGVEDIAVPPAALPLFFRHMQEALKRRQVTASLFGHAGHGQLHIRPLLDLSNPVDHRKLETLASDLYDKVWLLGGTVSGEHGDGLSRTPFSSRQHGPLVNVFREVKRLWDPLGLLNPGKIVPQPGARMTHNLRLVSPVYGGDQGEGQGPPKGALKPSAAKSDPVDLQLAWGVEEAAYAARNCNGCGACRTTDEDTRMCPIFRYTPREEASPRAKANLMRAVLTGALPPEEMFKDETKSVADLCVHCHMCRVECPAQVNIPRLMVEAKAEFIKTNGQRFDEWWSTRLDLVTAFLSRTPWLANAALGDPRVRWLLEKTTGLAQGRKLPKMNRRPYLREAASRRLHRASAKDKPLKLLYFVDTYANHWDRQLARAFELVLGRHDADFYVPSEQSQSGMALIAHGALDSARRVAERNISLLAEAIRQGYTVVATEPAAVLALTHEYPQLLADDEDAALVAENTFEACHFLWRLHQRGGLKLDFKPLPMTVGYHVPCHLKALEIGAPAENLMRLIPDLRVTRLEKGCSGMAGAYGLQRKNYRRSLRAGLPLLSTLRSGAFQVGATECGACKTQMQQGSSMPTLHPIKLLALSYGLMPKLAAELQVLASTDSDTREPAAAEAP